MATGGGSTGVLIERRLQKTILARLNDEPVLVLQGARTAGKSTVLRACAATQATPVLDLDDLATRRAVAADPSLFVTSANEPVCIDEFQHVPQLLDAIKAELNHDLRPGRYLMTGSTRYMTLPVASQSLSGRVHLVTLWPFSQGELRGRNERFLETLLEAPDAMTRARSSSTPRSDYEAAVLAGGFPLALSRTQGAARSRWFGDFVATVILRDVLEVRNVRQREILPSLLRLLSSQTAQVLNVSRIAAGLGLRRELVGDYVQLLESVFLTHRLEAFGRTLSTRVRQMPKVHLVDSGLGAFLLDITEARLSQRDPATLTDFGHLLETFAINEILKQASWSADVLRFSHYRTRDGAEVDLVIETGDGRVFGVEVKAAATAGPTDFRGLQQLRAKLGARFVAGVVLHLGQHSFRQADGLYGVPLDRLWE